MKTIGELLKQERIKQNKSFLKLHRETKIPEKTLIALEENQFQNLPPATFVIGFIKIYARALGLDEEKLVAIYRRDYLNQKSQEILPPTQNIVKRKFLWSPKTATFFIITLGVALVTIFAFWQLKKMFASPKLILKTPTENQITNNSSIEVVGEVDPDSTVFINDQLININEKGEFFYKLKLFPGKNKIIVRAQDRKNRETIISREIENQP